MNSLEIQAIEGAASMEKTQTSGLKGVNLP